MIVSKTLAIDLIRIDGGTQSRVQICESTVSEYCDLWAAKTALPAIDVFFDGTDYWLADGFHRYHGAKRANRASVPVEIHKGTKRDAILFSCGANRTHGLKRTNADKRRAVETLLGDEEWVAWSDHLLSEKAGVSVQFVASIRKQLSTVDSSPAAKQADKPRVGKDGKKRKKAKQTPVVGASGPDAEPTEEPQADPKPASSIPGFDADALEAEAQANKKARAAAAPQVDGWGVPIQSHAAEAFEAAPQFDEILKLLKQARTLYAKVAAAPGGEFLQRPGVSRSIKDAWRNEGLENAIAAVEDCKPTYTVCPREYHAKAFPESKHKHDKGCELCRGLNWSRPLGKQEVDPKVVETIKEAFSV